MSTAFDPTRFIFIDIEASSLSGDSWPIEIGLAWLDEDHEVQWWSSLIRPEPKWEMGAWSSESELVHGIPRRALDAAPPAAEVARRALEMIGARTVISDAPPFDQMWLNRLLATSPDAAPVTVDPLAAAFRCREVHTRAFLDFQKRNAEQHTHRAGPDAALLARCLKYALKKGRKKPKDAAYWRDRVMGRAMKYSRDRQEAERWYQEVELAGFGGQTAQQLIDEGEGRAVLNYLDANDIGVPD